MKTNILLIMAILLVSYNVFCQEETRLKYKNAIHCELGGTGRVYSFSYERNVLNLDILKVSLQSGIGFLPNARVDLYLPWGITTQVSFENHHLELGIGSRALRELNHDEFPNDQVENKFWRSEFTGRLGYRYQRPDSRFIWRVAFTPFLSRDRESIYDPTAPFKTFVPYGGVSVGYAF